MTRRFAAAIVALNALAFVAAGVVLGYLADAPRPAQYGFAAALLALLIAVAGLSALSLVSNTRRPRGPAIDPGPPDGVERRMSGFGRRTLDKEFEALAEAIQATPPGPGLAQKIKAANALDLEQEEDER